ncbi:nucleoside deaminase [Nanchangia anserum]|uniref:tRNA-specific adenosine deaminase n=2 Tax=Nanchangia anserum TaxID=2692125 RepID=A0A8I0G7U2_9ACTO|nr:nucleoside deaminase [Nanchangia anserum]QOX82656.1 nucleoside deaminase [Nanchangia anserum]
MDRALECARTAAQTDDVPVGALVVANADLAGDPARITPLGIGVNRREDAACPDPTAHAEVLAIRQAARALGRWRLHDTTLIVTLEPCLMCAGTILAARIPRIVFGAWDPKAGACGSTRDVVRDPRLNHTVEVFGGVREDAAARLLTDFFARHRRG